MRSRSYRAYIGGRGSAGPGAAADARRHIFASMVFNGCATALESLSTLAPALRTAPHEPVRNRSHGGRARGVRTCGMNTRISHSSDVYTPSQEEIESRAYRIWLEDGQPTGREMDHWHEAERQLRAEAILGKPPGRLPSPAHTAEPTPRPGKSASAPASHSYGDPEPPLAETIAEEMDNFPGTPERRSATSLLDL